MNINHGTHLELKSGYMNPAWRPDEVVRHARKALALIDYDTIVVTGISGALVGMILAKRLGKRLLVVRKNNDGTHSSLPVEGELGERWVFVDDFVNSGHTRRHVWKTVNRMAKRHGWSTEYVGTWSYTRRTWHPVSDHLEYLEGGNHDAEQRAPLRQNRPRRQATQRLIRIT